MAPPKFANVFMQPVTVPADSRAMSRQMAQTALMHKSAIPAVSAISNAATRELVVRAAIASNNPLPTRAVDTTPQRPTLNPYRRTHRSVQKPPVMHAPAAAQQHDRGKQAGLGTGETAGFPEIGLQPRQVKVQTISKSAICQANEQEIR